MLHLFLKISKKFRNRRDTNLFRSLCYKRGAGLLSLIPNKTQWRRGMVRSNPLRGRRSAPTSPPSDRPFGIRSRQAALRYRMETILTQRTQKSPSPPSARRSGLCNRSGGQATVDPRLVWIREIFCAFHACPSVAPFL